MSAVAEKHPKGLYVLFATEMWERFNYYGMRAILVLFLVKAMAFNQIDASQVYGSYTGLVYLTPLLGGYIADRYWGNKRSIIAGGLVMAIGEFVLFFCGQTESSISQAIQSLKGHTTVVMIAHRLSTVKNADLVVYLADGKIIDVGSFEEIRNRVPDFDLQAKLVGL